MIYGSRARKNAYLQGLGELFYVTIKPEGDIVWARLCILGLLIVYFLNSPLPLLYTGLHCTNLFWLH